mgnify:FL=1|tara:strand:- start:726 stop:908 length:183 start_codon:yes stop_codon:yes gene_type:complete
MKVIAKPVMRQYEVLLTEEDLMDAVGDGFGSDTIHVSHVDRAPNDDECMVRICITGVSEA